MCLSTVCTGDKGGNVIHKGPRRISYLPPVLLVAPCMCPGGFCGCASLGIREGLEQEVRDEQRGLSGGAGRLYLHEADRVGLGRVALAVAAVRDGAERT